MLNCEVIKTSLADCLKLNSSLIFKSFLTDLAPSISQANLVIFNFSSGSFTFPVMNILKQKKVDFKFDGDMQPDVALNDEYKELYPFSEIVGNANVLIMPGQHSAAISYKIMKTLGDTTVIGPLLIGLGEAIEIAPLRSSTSDILNLASVAAYSAGCLLYTSPSPRD